MIFDVKETEILLEIKSTLSISQELVKFILTFVMQISKSFMCNISRIWRWQEDNGKNHDSLFLNDFFIYCNR